MWSSGSSATGPDIVFDVAMPKASWGWGSLGTGLPNVREFCFLILGLYSDCISAGKFVRIGLNNLLQRQDSVVDLFV